MIYLLHIQYHSERHLCVLFTVSGAAACRASIPAIKACSILYRQAYNILHHAPLSIKKLNAPKTFFAAAYNTACIIKNNFGSIAVMLTQCTSLLYLPTLYVLGYSSSNTWKYLIFFIVATVLVFNGNESADYLILSQHSRCCL